MAISIDWNTKVISVPQSDLTLVSGSLYELDTNDLRLSLKALEAEISQDGGMPFEDTHRHNTEVTVAGTTFARTIEIINGYSILFTPDSQWSVRLVGSNNNFFDVENGILNQNQVHVISNNSAGLIVKTLAGGVGTPAEVADAVWDAQRSSHTVSGSFGEYIGKFLLTIQKFIGLK